jgi:aminopeptidase N
LNAGRDLLQPAADVAKFYAGLVGDAPYPSFTLALVESDVPGGHSPAYFAQLNTPGPMLRFAWRNDPVVFSGFPEFFLAHELAHQWWGQAVGWGNYHEQWISEGFAQYFAVLYAKQKHGAETFDEVLHQLRKWSLDESDQGPVYLGYRLGHIRGDTRVFRAVVYNKGAAVLHMLRQLVGDDVFFRGLRRFYTESRFKKVGTEDFRRTMEAEAGRSLQRFFDRWIYGATLPSVKFGYRVDGTDAVLQFEQTGEVFDIPVMVTLEYADNTRTDVLVAVTDQTTERRVPLAGTLRTARVSDADVSLAQIK